MHVDKRFPGRLVFCGLLIGSGVILAAGQSCDDTGVCQAPAEDAGRPVKTGVDVPVQVNEDLAKELKLKELHADKDLRVLQFEGLLTQHEASSLARVHMDILKRAPPAQLCGSLELLAKLVPAIRHEEHVFGTTCLNQSASARHAGQLMKHATFSTAFYSGDISFTNVFDRRVQSLLGFPPEAGGRFQVTSHPQGTGYGKHTDCAGELVDRAATVLIYLADVASGGETTFPELGLSVQPRTARGVVWNSMKAGHCLPNSVHSAEKVLKGRKFTLQRWYYNASLPGLGRRRPEPFLPPRPDNVPMLMCDDAEADGSFAALPTCRLYDEWAGRHLTPPVANTYGRQVRLGVGEVHTVDNFLSEAQVAAVRQRLKSVKLNTVVRNGAVMRAAKTKRSLLEDDLLMSVLMGVVDYANTHLIPAATVTEFVGSVVPHSADFLQYGALSKVSASSLAVANNIKRSGAGAHADSDFPGRCLSAALHLRVPRAGGEFALHRCPLADCKGLTGDKLKGLYRQAGLQDLPEEVLVPTQAGRLIFFLSENIHSVRDVLEGTRESLFLWMTCDLDDMWNRKNQASIHSHGADKATQ